MTDRFIVDYDFTWQEIPALLGSDAVDSPEKGEE